MSDPHVGSREEREAELVLEIDVTDLTRSLAFYTALGFALERRTEAFAAMRWGRSYFFLNRAAAGAPASALAGANLRVMVSDVDAVWARVVASGAAVERAIDDRRYGLRDFTIRDPDGFSLRFAASLGG